MNIPYSFNKKPTCLRIVVKTKYPENMIIRVVDAKKPNTFYEDRYQKVFKEDVFSLKLPLTPKDGIIQVFNGAKGNLPSGQDKSFSFSMKEVPLKRYLMPYRIDNELTRNFVEFAEEFSEDASIISAGNGKMPYSIYKSKDGKLRIDYHDALYDTRTTVIDRRTGREMPNPNYGREVTTPMRTNAETGVIEVSKRVISTYTVPMRIAILLHEYSHFYINVKPEDEEEADFNALLIFLSLGYSKIAAYKAFCEVFKPADSPSNRQRDKKIKDFIDNFENMQFRLIK
jgi:hypothetical protein